jgi:hypothetical protein
MRKINRKPLDKKTGERVIKYLQSKPEWTPIEAPDEIYNIDLVRKEESLSVMISGSEDNPVMAHNLKNIILGIDVLVVETNPNIEKHEPPGNAYHYIIQLVNHNDYPYVLYGPYKAGTIVPHWFNDEELDKYWNSS